MPWPGGRGRARAARPACRPFGIRILPSGIRILLLAGLPGGLHDAVMKHLGILAHSMEGAALCLRTFCLEGSDRMGAYQHPDVTLDCIALARSMPAWDEGNYLSIRDTLAVSVRRLARAGADFFVCPDNTAHLALEYPGPELALPGLHIAEIVARQAAMAGYRTVGV